MILALGSELLFSTTLTETPESFYLSTARWINVHPQVTWHPGLTGHCQPLSSFGSGRRASSSFPRTSSFHPTASAHQAPGPSHEEDNHSYSCREMTGTGFPCLSTRDILGQMILCCGAVLYTILCSLMSLASIHNMPIASPSQLWPKKCLQAWLWMRSYGFLPLAASQGCGSATHPSQRGLPQSPGPAHLSLFPYTLPWQTSVHLHLPNTMEPKASWSYLSDPQIAQTLSKPNKSSLPLLFLPKPGLPPTFSFNREHHHPIQSPKPQTLASSSMPPHLRNYQVLEHLPPRQVYLSMTISLVSAETHLNSRAWMTPTTSHQSSCPWSCTPNALHMPA